jgi:hypothetical protein
MNAEEMAAYVAAAQATAQQEAWIGVDLDATLAEWHGWSPDIGRPIPRMVQIIRDHLAASEKVKVLTARACEHREYWAEKIGDWTEEHIGQRLEITAAKDHFMTRFYDDRCVQVIENTGMPIGAIPGVADLVEKFHREELKRHLREARKITVQGFTAPPGPYETETGERPEY